ncbi:MAG: hypothetical protein ACOZNI_22310 [Myxococcota bacterium]
MSLLIPSAWAHPDAMAHVHANDPSALVLVSAWLVIGLLWWAWARRVDPARP